MTNYMNISIWLENIEHFGSRKGMNMFVKQKVT